MPQAGKQEKKSDRGTQQILRLANRAGWMEMVLMWCRRGKRGGGSAQQEVEPQTLLVGCMQTDDHVLTWMSPSLWELQKHEADYQQKAIQKTTPRFPWWVGPRQLITVFSLQQSPVLIAVCLRTSINLTTKHTPSPESPRCPYSRNSASRIESLASHCHSWMCHMHPVFHPNGKVCLEEPSITQLTLVLKGLIMFKASLRRRGFGPWNIFPSKKMCFVKAQKLKKICDSH